MRVLVTATKRRNGVLVVLGEMVDGEGGVQLKVTAIIQSVRKGFVMGGWKMEIIKAQCGGIGKGLLVYSCSLKVATLFLFRTPEGDMWASWAIYLRGMNWEARRFNSYWCGMLTMLGGMGWSSVVLDVGLAFVRGHGCAYLGMVTCGAWRVAVGGRKNGFCTFPEQSGLRVGDKEGGGEWRGVRFHGRGLSQRDVVGSEWKSSGDWGQGGILLGLGPVRKGLLFNVIGESPRVGLEGQRGRGQGITMGCLVLSSPKDAGTPEFLWERDTYPSRLTKGSVPVDGISSFQPLGEIVMDGWDEFNGSLE
ncbi:hypothetical protein Tco_0196689 [Tanacetum coccineum]